MSVPCKRRKQTRQDESARGKQSEHHAADGERPCGFAIAAPWTISCHHRSQTAGPEHGIVG
jgi:hypothetical protein